jgi:cell shape-determining protein MreC
MGFLEGKTKTFITELWNLLLSAQSSVGGIPAVFIEQKKEELRKQKELQDQRQAQRDSVMDAIKKRKQDEMNDLRESGKRRSRFVCLYFIQSMWCIKVML